MMKDLVSLDQIKVQRLEGNNWIWSPVWQTCDDITDPPASGDLSGLGYEHTKNFRIANAAEGRPWKIKGACGSPDGAWTIKVKVGKNNDPGSFAEYNATVNVAAGTFEMEVGEAHLGQNDFTWAWVSDASHAPPNPQGLKVVNPLRVTTS